MSFIDELMGQLDSRHRLILVALLSKYGGTTIYLPIESQKDRRIRAARNMIENGMSNREICEELRKRFGKSARQITRDVKAARIMS